MSDVLITILPLPFLCAIRMCPIKKLAVGGMLLTGGIVIGAGIGRTYAFFTVGHSQDYTYENYHYLIWSSVEPCVGVIGCCLPTLRPLFINNDRSAHSRYYTKYGRNTAGSRHTPRHMASMEAALTMDSCELEHGVGVRYHKESELTSIGEEQEIPPYGGTVALYNATPRLDEPGPSGPSRSQSRKHSVDRGRERFDSIGTAH